MSGSPMSTHRENAISNMVGVENVSVVPDRHRGTIRTLLFCETGDRPPDAPQRRFPSRYNTISCCMHVFSLLFSVVVSYGERDCCTEDAPTRIDVVEHRGFAVDRYGDDSAEVPCSPERIRRVVFLHFHVLRARRTQQSRRVRSC